MSDTTRKLIQAYDNMMEQVHYALEHEGQNLKDALAHAEEKASELNELSREEADKIADFLHKDMQDAAQYIAETESELSDWLQFDLQLLESNMQTWMTAVADPTWVEWAALSKHSNDAPLYQTGELTGPGTLTCQNCGETIQLHETDEIPDCPRCHHTIFQKSPS